MCVCVRVCVCVCVLQAAEAPARVETDTCLPLTSLPDGNVTAGSKGVCIHRGLHGFTNPPPPPSLAGGVKEAMRPSYWSVLTALDHHQTQHDGHTVVIHLTKRSGGVCEVRCTSGWPACACFSMWYSRYSGTAAVQQVQQRYSNGTAGTPAVQHTRIGLLYRVLGTEGTPGTPGTAVQHRTAGTADRCGSQGRLPNKEGPAEAEGVDRHALGHAPPNKEGCQIKKARPRPRGSLDTTRPWSCTCQIRKAA